MTEETITVAEPSPAQQDPMKASFEAWQKTARPEPKAQEPAPADAPKEEITEEKSESAPETVAGKEPPQEKRPGSKLSADERISQLIAQGKRRDKEHEERYARLERELKELREAKTARAESSPAPKPEPEPELKRPKWETWAGTAEEFNEAMDNYEAQKEKKLRESLKLEIQQQQAQEDVNRRTRAMIQEARGRYEDFDAVTKPVHDRFFATTDLNPIVTARLGNSRYAADIFYNLGKDPATFDRFMEVAKSNPFEALDRIRDTELLIEKEISKTKEPEAEKEEVKAPAPPETKAPPPPKEVGGRAAAPADPIEAAGRRRDFRALDQALTAKYFGRK